MGERMFAIPILPGKTEQAKEFFATMNGARRAEAEAAGKRHGLRKETFFIQSSPQGDMILIYIEADDPDKANAAYAADDDPFVVWNRQQSKEITGFDLADTSAPKPPPPLQVWKLGY